jgi:hypothetical protein
VEIAPTVHELTWCQECIDGICFTNKLGAASLRPLFKPPLKLSILKCISWLNGSFFRGEHRGFLKEWVKTYQMAPMSPLNCQLFFFASAHLYFMTAAAVRVEWFTALLISRGGSVQNHVTGRQHSAGKMLTGHSHGTRAFHRELAGSYTPMLPRALVQQPSHQLFEASKSVGRKARTLHQGQPISGLWNGLNFYCFMTWTQLLGQFECWRAPRAEIWSCRISLIDPYSHSLFECQSILYDEINIRRKHTTVFVFGRFKLMMRKRNLHYFLLPQQLPWRFIYSQGNYKIFVSCFRNVALNVY